jgi:hypothetical protein
MAMSASPMPNTTMSRRLNFRSSFMTQNSSCALKHMLQDSEQFLSADFFPPTSFQRHVVAALFLRQA